MLKQENSKKEIFKQVFYIDIKFNELEDILTIVLRNVHELSLKENKITI